MSDDLNPRDVGLNCSDCRERLPAYLDGGLSRRDSLQIFLHLRGCDGCVEERDRQQRLIGLLESLPSRDPPFDLDARILASVPYEAYRAMAELRRPRVPVYLAEASLPAWIRSRAIRAIGVAVAATALAGYGAGLWPAPVLIATVGLAPELLLRAQGLGRRLVLAAGHARRGA
jgi:anti-sigma factor RsiW